jgi:hypothetical protein
VFSIDNEVISPPVSIGRENPMPRCSRIEIDVDYTRNDVETDGFDM